MLIRLLHVLIRHKASAYTFHLQATERLDAPQIMC